MATFTQRTEAPTKDNAYYYANNPFYQSGYGLPNCTCYAFGRFWELAGGSRPSLSWADAESWYGHNDGYERGQTPKLGAVICWRRGVVGDDSDGAGHVAIVEQINDDGSIVTSNSAYGSTLFYRQTLTKASGYTWNSKYVFQGFIYNPVNFDGETEPLTFHTGNRYLTHAEMEDNARYIWNYLGVRGWSRNAVAGMLGNMETESTINPGIWQGLNGGVGPAFGLVQWDPYTKYTNWCDELGIDPEHMDSALTRIEYELENGLQYYATPNYPETFAEFKVSTATPYYLGMAFLANYERPADPDQPARGVQAEYWFSFLEGITPEDPSNPAPAKKKKRLPLILLLAATRGRR